MSEQQNVEIARVLSEPDPEEGGAAAGAKRRWEEVLEIVELAFLAIIAIATAWSGYQAARWDGHQSLLYGQATGSGSRPTRSRRGAASSWWPTRPCSTRGSRPTTRGTGTWNVNSSVGSARTNRVAFEAWLATDPFTDPSAPPGPGFMPQLRNPLVEQSTRLNAHAEALFDEGTAARETADKYVRDTVLFASVLFLIAIGQRFKLRGVRMGANVLALGLLVLTLLTMFTLPRL